MSRSPLTWPVRFGDRPASEDAPGPLERLAAICLGPPHTRERRENIGLVLFAAAAIAASVVIHFA